jgi:hypothetical protein
MHFPVHKGLGITPNIEQSVVKVLVSQFHYLPTHPLAKASFEQTNRTTSFWTEK